MNNQMILRKALKANGIFSGASAVVALMFSSSILAVNEMAGGNGILFGGQLIIFAIFVLFNAYRKSVSKVMVSIIILLDALYVLQSLIILVRQWAMTSGGGLTLIIVSNIAVSTFAYFQFVGLRMTLNPVSHE